MADLISPDFSVLSMTLDTGTMNVDCLGNGNLDCAVYQMTQQWDTGAGTSDYNFTLGGNDSDGAVASGNAYVHVRGAIDWVRSVLPTWNPLLPDNDQILAVSANVPAREQFGVWLYINCDAWFSLGNGIGLGAGGSCGPGSSTANAASSTIVRHEFGHLFLRTNLALKNQVISGCGRDEYYGFDEGAADAFAALSLGTSCIGENWKYPNSCTRDLDGEYQYPSGNSAHSRGRPLASAFWHLYEDMVAAQPTNGAQHAGILFILALQSNTGCWESIREDMLLVDTTILTGQYSALINAALDRHNLPPVTP